MSKYMCQRCGNKFSNKTNGPTPRYCPECQEIVDKLEEKAQMLREQAPEMLDMSEYPEYKPREAFPDEISYAVAYTITVKASDLHFKAGAVPMVRKGDVLFRISDHVITSEEVWDFIISNVKSHSGIDATECVYDFSFDADGARFRCCAYHSMRGWCVAMRYLTAISAFDFEKLGIPEIVKSMIKRRNGLILVTGPTGSGKSTTLTCILNYLNENERKHIITVEDPIEFVHENKKCLISQREINRDTTTFENAIVEALREDPDIIMIGEMRDLASIEAALRAAETGHLVLSTLHTRGAASTITRILDVFPADQQQQIRTQLSMCLVGTITQQLVPTKKAGERCLATEIMVVNDAIRASIRENKIYFIDNCLQLGSSEGMVTMKDSLTNLYNTGRITQKNMEEFSKR